MALKACQTPKDKTMLDHTTWRQGCSLVTISQLQLSYDKKKIAKNPQVTLCFLI